MRDWVMKKFQDDEGQLDIDEASEFIRTYIPKRGEWKAIQNRIVTHNERVKFLGRVSVNIDIKTQEVSFALPDFGLGYTIVPANGMVLLHIKILWHWTKFARPNI